MAKIVHLALKVDEIDRTGAFYQDVFGFQDAETKKTRDHTSRHMPAVARRSLAACTR